MNHHGRRSNDDVTLMVDESADCEVLLETAQPIAPGHELTYDYHRESGFSDTACEDWLLLHGFLPWSGDGGFLDEATALWTEAHTHASKYPSSLKDFMVAFNDTCIGPQAHHRIVRNRDGEDGLPPKLLRCFRLLVLAEQAALLSKRTQGANCGKLIAAPLSRSLESRTLKLLQDVLEQGMNQADHAFSAVRRQLPSSELPTAHQFDKALLACARAKFSLFKELLRRVMLARARQMAALPAEEL